LDDCRAPRRATPDRLQHLLEPVDLGADTVRDDVRRYVCHAFADPQSVLVVDDTGDLKKGQHSVGVQR